MNSSRFLLLTVLLSSCGPSRVEEIIPRYAILTTFGPESAMHSSVDWLAARRYGRVRQFRVDDLSLVRSWLRDFDPTYVAVFLRPEDLDQNFHLTFLDLACGLDDDPFPDFAFGYFMASSAADLQRQMKNLQGVEAKLERRLKSFTEFEAGAAATSDETRKLLWATDLPVRRFTLKEGDVEQLRKNSDAIERSAFLVLSGKGWPEGIRGLPASEIQRLKMDSTVIFSAVDFSGAAGAGFDAEGGLVRRWTVPPDRSLVLNFVRCGAAAILAPLGATRPGLADFEWSDALLTDTPLGWTMKHGYDLAVLQAGGPPKPERLVETKGPPAGFGGDLRVATTRVLFGDPMLRPYSRPVLQPVLHVRTAVSGKTPEGDTLMESTWKVAAYDCPPYFSHPAGGKRIPLRIPLPRDTRRARAELKACHARETPVAATVAAQALEVWRGDPVLHVLLRGENLATEDLFIELSIAYR